MSKLRGILFSEINVLLPFGCMVLMIRLSRSTLPFEVRLDLGADMLFAYAIGIALAMLIEFLFAVENSEHGGDQAQTDQQRQNETLIVNDVPDPQRAN